METCKVMEVHEVNIEVQEKSVKHQWTYETMGYM